MIFSFKKPTLFSMLICHCNGVTDRRIRAAVKGGACTLRDVARSCGAGGGCGGCRPEVARILRQEAAQTSEVDPTPMLFAEAPPGV